MRLIRVALAAVAFALVSLSTRGATATPPTADLVAEAELRDALVDLESKSSHPLSLEVNPFMGVAAEAISGNVEYVPVRHLGILASPRASLTMPAWVGEVGARYYTTTKREAAGFFAGPAVVYGQTRGASLYGVAVDVGVQTIFRSGLTIGAGIGLQYLTGTFGNSALEVGPLETDDSRPRRALLPRLLFSVGYSL